MTAAPRTLEGVDGLRLDAAAPDDAEAVLRVFADDPDVVRYVAWRPRTTHDQAERFLTVLRDDWRQDRWFWFARRDGEVAGGIIAAREGDEVEVSYVVARDAWGQGVATAMVNLVCSWALAALPIRCVRACADAENLASRRVLEKAGFSLVAELPAFGVHNISPAPRDCVRYERR